MRRFGWTRLAYLLFVLTALTILVRIGNSGAEALSLSAEAPDAAEGRETPNLGRLTEGAFSSLEDARGEVGGPDAPKAPGIVEPRVPPVPAVEEEETGPARRRATPAAGSSGVRDAAVPNTAVPVFYRPSGSDVAFDSRSGSGPVCGDLGRFPESSKVVFPLQEEYFYSYEDTWGAARPQGGHEGTDLMTPAGVPEYAVTDGTVVPVAGANDDGWNTLGGYAVMIRADHSIGPVEKGDLFYYAHLEREGPLPIGTRVRAGQVVGYAGDTGQGPEGTSGLFPPHLHLGWYDGTGGRSEVASGAMNPYPLLEWIRANGGAVTGGSDARFCEALGPPPSNWPDQKDSGIRPDIDTGSDDPRPSPVGERDTRENTEESQARAKKPERSSRSDRPPKKERDDQRKPADAERRNVQRPQKPERPNGKPSTPESSAPGQALPNRPARSPEADQGSQHDDDSRGPTDAPDETGPPDADQEPGGDPDGGDVGDETVAGESDPLKQYDPATGT